MTDDASMQERAKIPTTWETTGPYYYNHGELQYVNNLAKDCGANRLPFQYVDQIQPDNGERFFSEYLDWLNTEQPTFDAKSLCICRRCTGAAVALESVTLVSTNESAAPEAQSTTATTATADAHAASTVAQPSPPLITNGNVNANFNSTPAVAQLSAPLHPLLPILPNQLWQSAGIIPTHGYDFCCAKYRSYCFGTARGRPPKNKHDKGCPGANVS